MAPRPLHCQITANQRKAEMSASANKQKICAKGNDVITNVISANPRQSAFHVDFFNADIQIPET